MMCLLRPNYLEESITLCVTCQLALILCTKMVINGRCSKTLNHITYHTNVSMKVICNSKCQLLKIVRDYNTIIEEDLKHVGIK